MRLISIENKDDTNKTIINTSQICSIYTESGVVIISTGDDRSLRTKFTDVDHAVDYIQRASSLSLNG